MEARRFHRQADRAGEDVRRPGGDRHRERAPVQRDEGGARTADGDIARSLRVISGSPTDASAGARRDRASARAAMRCGAVRGHVLRDEGTCFAHRRGDGGARAEWSTAAQELSGQAGRDPGRQCRAENIRSGAASGPTTPCVIRVRRSMRRPRLASNRSVAVTPLLRDGASARGHDPCWREHEVRPFERARGGSAQTFADQAVIAHRERAPFQCDEGSARSAAGVGGSARRDQQLDRGHASRCSTRFSRAASGCLPGETVGITLVRDDGMLDGGAITARASGAHDHSAPLPRDTATGRAILARQVRVYSDVDVASRHVAGWLPFARHSVDGVRADAVGGSQHRHGLGRSPVQGRSPTSTSRC